MQNHDLQSNSPPWKAHIRLLSFDYQAAVSMQSICLQIPRFGCLKNELITLKQTFKEGVVYASPWQCKHVQVKIYASQLVISVGKTNV